MAKSIKAPLTLIRNRQSYEAVVHSNPEKGGGISQTIPNQAISLQELINRFTISSEWPKPTPEQFDNTGTSHLPDISKLDKIEIQTLANENAAAIEEHKAALQTLQEEEFKRVQEEQTQAKIQAAIQAQSPPKQENPNS